MSPFAKASKHATKTARRFSSDFSANPPFTVGCFVLLTLENPREKFWGALLGLDSAGISIRGISLASLDDCIQQLRGGERVDATSVFFPMHRVERMEMDAPSGEIPSLAQRFELQSGIAPAAFLGVLGVER